MLRRLSKIFFLVAAICHYAIVQANEIVFAQSAPLSGPIQALGEDYQLGAKLVFDAVNANGGIKGRKIVLRTEDDAYDPVRTLSNAKKLIADDSVLALFGFFGTANALSVIPVASQSKIALFAPYTGAQELRGDMNRYVFNLRASYSDEAEIAVKQLVADGAKRIAVAHLDGGYGRSGLASVSAALAKRDLKVLGSASYKLGGVGADVAADTIHKLEPEAIIVVGSTNDCADFMKFYRAKGGIFPRIVSFSPTSPIGVAARIGPQGAGLMVTQVVPSPFALKYPWVVDYQSKMRAANRPYSYISLEGYLAARLAVDALRKGGDASREAFVKALESLGDTNYPGFPVAFGARERNASRFVELTVLDKTGGVRY